MKNTVLNYLAALATASITMYGCAGSSQTASNSTMDSGMSRTETSAMAGVAAASNENKMSVLVVEEQVMVPIGTLSVTALALENPEEVDNMFGNLGDTENHDVVKLLKSSPNLSTFAQLMERANLMDDLQRIEKLTLFAPTNEAFAKLPKSQLENLLRSENTAVLSKLMQTHVLASEVSTAQLQNNTRIEITNDSYIPVDRELTGSLVRVGGAQIIRNDIEASNGRIHVIDSVILPSQDIREGNLR